MFEGNDQKPRDAQTEAEPAMLPDRRSGSGAWGFARVSEADGLSVDHLGADSPAPVTVSLSSLARHKWLMAAAFVLVAGLAIPLVWIAVKPEFSSTATIRVAPLAPRILYKTEGNSTMPMYRSYLNTQVSIVRSPTVLQRVLEQGDVQATAWYKQKRTALLGNPPTPMEVLAGALVVRPRRNTELVDVRLTTESSKDSKLIVDAVVEQYIQISDGVMRRSEAERLEALNTEYRNVQNEITGEIAQRFNIAARFGSALPEDVGAQLTRELNALKAALTQLQINQEVRKFELEKLSEGADGPDMAEDAEDVEAKLSEHRGAKESLPTAQYTQDTTWARRYEEVENARHTLELARQRFGEEHPTIKAAISDVSHALSQLQRRESELDGGSGTVLTQASARGTHTVVPGFLELEHAYQVQDKRQQELERAVNGLLAEIETVGGLARELAANEERLGQKRRLRDDLRERLQALTMESKAPGRISIASKALKNARPSRDRRPLLSGLAVFAAFVAAAGVGYLRSSTDTVIYGPSDVVHVSRSPFLGQLPKLEPGSDLTRNTEMGAAMEESIRMLRTTLLHRLSPSKTSGSVVAITSAGPNAGKTTLAILLAKSLRKLEQKVLLVDADFRKCSLSRVLGAEHQSGLVDSLSKRISYRDSVIHSDASGCDLLPAGRLKTQRDHDLLANGAMSAYVQRWKADYGFVIVDSPPILSTADGRILAGQSDGAVMVLKASHCRKLDAMAAYAGLSSCGATLLGTVLVGTQDSSAYYAHDYYSKPQETPDAASFTDDVEL